MSPNWDQANHDTNFIDLSPWGRPFNDTTRVDSDKFDSGMLSRGDACDDDDNNDGIPDTTELAGPPCASASAATDPVKLDTDGDRFADGAECLLGTDPADALSRPPAYPANDTDRDGLPDAVEMSLGTNPANRTATATACSTVWRSDTTRATRW